MLIFFEFLTLAIFAANLTFMVRRKDYASLSALAAGFITVGLGEYRNAFVDKVTSYNEGFLIWIPKTGVPFFIICGGATVPSLIYQAAKFAADKITRFRILVELICLGFISLVAPAVELSGIALNLWKWNRDYTVNAWWCFGIWIFYSLFLATPALLAIIVEVILKKGSHSTDS